ncbi:hypothetical protein LIER_23516 [Lithospermum erythrorhizon]|uniref:Uncharacterized protein n=1 Tax=Lithospermum erythrorhizon TaxID=34254 RepID=A0AAV3QZ43_LITER
MSRVGKNEFGDIVDPCCIKKDQLHGKDGSPSPKMPSYLNVPRQPSPLSSTSKHRLAHRSPPIGILAPTPSSGGRGGKNNDSSTITVVQATLGGGYYLLVFLLLGLFYFMKKNRKLVRMAMHGGERQI